MLKRAVANLLLWFLGRGICACAAADSRVQTEVRGWSEGLRIALLASPSGPGMAVEKRDGRLLFWGTRHLPPADLTITFKYLDASLPVLLGQTSVAQAFAGRRLTLHGDIALAMSVVRVMLLVEAYLFPAFITRRIMQQTPGREVTMARIYLSTLLADHSR